MTYEQAPNKRVTILGTAAIDHADGSGRGFDATIGWDKSFIGTGLRTLEGGELAIDARKADILRPMRLLDACSSTTVEAAGTDA